MTDNQLIIGAIVVLIVAGWLSIKVTGTAIKLALYAVVIIALGTMFRDKLPF